MKIEDCLTSDLTPHPLNAKIYGDIADVELRESIENFGILQPITITEAGTIISGHRRHNAAVALDLETVPVTVSDLTDPLDLEAAVIHANRQREKTTEIKAREYKKLKEIETKRAKKRQSHGKTAPGKTLRESLPQASKGKAREKAAKKVGMSGRTAEKAAKVVDKIDELEKKGEIEKAQNLRTKLNNKSVSGAHKAATGAEMKPIKKIEPETSFNDSFENMVEVFGHRIDFERESGWPTISKQDAIASIQALITRCYCRNEIMAPGGEVCRGL